MELSAALVGTYATMYADNYFSSPALVKQLLEKKSDKKTKTQELQRGDFQIFHCKQESINVIKWVDNKPVHIIKSKNPCAEVENVMRRRGSRKKFSWLPISHQRLQYGWSGNA